MDVPTYTVLIQANSEQDAINYAQCFGFWSDALIGGRTIQLDEWFPGVFCISLCGYVHQMNEE